MSDQAVRYQVLELNGTRFAVLPELIALDLGARAGITLRPREAASADAAAAWESPQLARRLRERRRRAGLTQVELARRAGVRVETLNRIERGHTTPDFATVRKLVVAMTAAEKILMQETET